MKNGRSMALIKMKKERIDTALEKGAGGIRLDRDDALSLMGLINATDIFRLGNAAKQNREARHGDTATFVHNVQVNPSNICEGTCGFCRYRAGEGDAHAYVLDETDILSKIEALSPTEVHIVGGMNRVWPFERNLALLKTIRTRFPTMHIKAFTAVEIDYFARKSDLTVQDVLAKLKDAGLNALPGGGAELFSKKMRQAHCPDKLSAKKWIQVHTIAHQMRISTNGTMLYGLGESDEELVDHLLMLREAQDVALGFSCFIPLPFQPGEAADMLNSPPPMHTLGIIAMARLVLDNIPHIKAYWPMVGLETTSAALSFGADDLDGTIGEERIAHAAGAKTPKAMSREKMETTIRLGGYVPKERNGEFDLMDNGRGQS